MTRSRPQEWRPRRSVLFTPATRTDRWQKALSGPADVAVADLEDAVAASEKTSARVALARALAETKPGPTERAVRINAWPSREARADLEALLPQKPDLVAVPKVEDPETVREIDSALRAHNSQAGLLLLLETARGVLAADEIASASDRIVAVAFGAEDYAASVGARRTPEGLEVLYARSHVLAAAAAAGVEAIDQVFVAIDDLEGLDRDTRLGAQLGYTGKQLIHPKQIEIVHRAFRPEPHQVEWAKRVCDAATAAGASQGGVVVVDGKMVDAPLLTQAERILALSRLP